MTTLRVKFEDVDLQPVYIPSTWKVVEEGARKSTKSQTTPELWQFQETEMQTGIYTDIVQDQVSEKYSGMPLLTHYRKKHKNKTEAEWRTAIEDGYVTVDCEVVTDVQAKVEKDFFLEYVDLKTNIGTQTKSGKEDSKEADEVTFDDQSVADFLQKVTPAVLKELDSGSTTRAFDMMNMSSTDDALEEISYWKVLSVDLEKKKVIFPDWTKATHYHGTIIKCTVTRNKERIYDVEYEDGTRLNGVREEYIRLLSDVPSSNKRNQNTTSIVSRLQEGVRVHAKVTMKGGYVKFLPGRVSKVVRSGIYDVECEGSRMEMGLTSDDLRIGLEERQKVEARRPNKVILQCTGTSWNATGNMIAVSYGRNDIIGWCDFPGAVCCWNVFSKAFNPHSPDFVLDHAASLMCVKYHPQSPALVVAGSFNGEVIVWDLTTPEQPLAISAIVEYAHKEPVMDVSWVYDSYKSEWMIASVGADGKLLFWSLKNGLEHPVKGATLSKGRSKKQYPPSHGATSISFASNGIGSAGSSVRAKWMLIGEEGGVVVRSQLSKVLNGPVLTAETFKSNPAIEEVFPSLKRGEDTFNNQSHIGCVNSVECSPFHRNLFLSGGSDGTVKFSHVLDRTPIFTWEPLPPPGTPGTSQFSAITAVSFSPIRPLVFAVASAEGFLYIYDLLSNTTSPVAMLEAPLVPPVSLDEESDANPTSPVGRGKKSSSRTRADQKKSAIAEGDVNRVGITGIAFNQKQRDLIAACDHLGRIHIWRLNWKLSNLQQGEQVLLNVFGNVAEAMDN